MKYKSLGDFSFFMDANHFVYDFTEDESIIHIYVKSKPHSSFCPECGSQSTQIHATYERILQDTPIHCKQTFIHANVYKYECQNPACNRSVFMEKLLFAKSSQVRTDALNSLILGVSMFLSNEGASKVLGLLGIKISNDSIQRLYDNIEFKDDPNVEEIGVDDIAIRKGQKYATAIYDLKDHHLITLLEGRDGQSLREWLKRHKKVKLVARDRASAYASAISEIVPECIQVADRFHLLQNLLEQMKDIFKEDMPPEIFIRNSDVLDKAPGKVLKEKIPDERLIKMLHYDNSIPQTPDGTEIKFNSKLHDVNSQQYIEQAESRKKNNN